MLVLTNRRTVLFSFVSCLLHFSRAVLAHAAQGFDEEVGGARGAKPLSELLYRRYGRDGVAFVFDEGFTGVDEDFGRTFARVGIAEKGCLTLELSVHTSGGHSSAPPTHTGIGIMSRLLVELENNPFLPAIDERNPLLTYLECAAQHGDMDDEMKAQVRQTQCWPLLADTLNQDKAYMPFLRTTQVCRSVRLHEQTQANQQGRRHGARRDQVQCASGGMNRVWGEAHNSCSLCTRSSTIGEKTSF
jgi:hypothetical protein